MASRYPLVVNTAIPRIEELKGVDDLNLSNSLIELKNGLPTATNQIPRYDGADLSWISGNTFVLNVVPDLVRTATTQTLTNKTIDGGTNTLQNIPNSSLVNDSITIDGTEVFLGDSIGRLDTDTKYEFSGTSIVNQVSIKLQAYDIENNTVTNPVPNGDSTIRFVGSGATTVSWNGVSKTVTISSTDTDTNSTYSALASGGIAQTGSAFSLNGSGSFTTNRVLKWNGTSFSLQNSNITDTGSLITLSSATEISSTLRTTGDVTFGSETPSPSLNLRGGVLTVGGNANIVVRQTTNGLGVTLTDTRLIYDATTGAKGWKIVEEGDVAQARTISSVTTIMPAAANPQNSSLAAAPATNGAIGRAGEVRWDTGFVYFCVANNNWIRVVRSAF
jgi:hypothetical protein